MKTKLENWLSKIKKTWKNIRSDFDRSKLRSLYCKYWKRRNHIIYIPRYLERFGYCDRTEALPNLMFEILSKFIEEECNPGIVDWEASGYTINIEGKDINVRTEMQTLYDWWHNYWNKERIQQEEDLWQEIEKICRVHQFIPIDKNHNEVLEKDAELFKWKLEFKSEEDKNLHNILMDKLIQKERNDQKLLLEMMHRLVNLQPYLWT